MNADLTPMLFCPPLPPLGLSAGSSAGIGRHASCQLVVPKDDVSRRHAEVYFEAGRFWLLDLGSTNGTFLNGTAIVGATMLKGGDRIDIGSSTITFCEVDAKMTAPPEPASAAKTMIEMPMPAMSDDSLHGTLREIPADALLQLLEMSHRSGLLEVDTPDGTASAWIDAGRIVHAKTEKQLGFDAALTLATRAHGRFRFEPGVASDDRTIVASITDLLVEAHRVQRQEAL